jgi:hypothetical protein
MPSRGAEDTRLVSADLVPEVEQIALELLARDDRTLRWGRFSASAMRDRRAYFPPAAADDGKQKPA